MNTGLTNTHIEALALDPQTPTIVYAGTFGGGVFKSTDEGTSWIATGLPNIGVGALALDSIVGLTLYAGTFRRGVFVSQLSPKPVGETPLAVPATTLTTFSLGDWVKVVTDQDCLEVKLLEPDPSGHFHPVPYDSPLGCLPYGFVGLVVGGPDQANSRTWWVLAGLGWVPEDSLRFHHGGELPYPQRPELAKAGRISFLGLDGDVWIMNGDGSNKRKLFKLGARDSDLVSLRWSPDGSKFAVAEHFRNVIHVVSADGDPILQLPAPGHFFPRWSPTDDAFAASGEPLVVFSLKGDVVIKLPGAHTSVSFSANGRRLAFFKIVGPGGLDPDVRGMVADLYTGKVQPIDPKEDPPRAYYQGPPIWSPSNPSLLAYGGRLFNLDTGQEGSLPGLAASWSPNGRLLLLAICGDRGIQAQVYDVETSSSILEFDVVPDGGDAPCWAHAQGMWSPDGRYFAYLNTGDSPPQTSTLQVWDSTNGQTKTIGNCRTLGEFSRDNQHILFATPVYHTSARRSWIWVMDADGSNLTLLAEGNAPAWQPVPR
jgi:hypothetical protein